MSAPSSSVALMNPVIDLAPQLTSTARKMAVLELRSFDGVTIWVRKYVNTQLCKRVTQILKYVNVTTR